MVKRAWIAMVVLAGCANDGDDRCDPNAPNTICTIAGNGQRDFAAEDLPARDTPLYMPMDVAVAPDGELWVIDFNNYVVRAIDERGWFHRVIGTGELGSSPPAGVPSVPATEAPMNHVANLVFHDGYAYVAAWHNSRVQRVDLATMQLEVFAGAGRRSYYTGDGGPALDAAFDLPAALAVSPSGTIVITDQANQVIREVLADGTVRRIAGACIAELDFENLCEPSDALIACPGSDKRVCNDVAECSGPCAPAFGGDGGPALAARFAFGYGASLPPNGRLAYDRDGNLLVADTENQRIRKIDRAGTITTIAGTGVRGYAGDGGPALAAQLDYPVDLAVADDGSIYFTDVYNHCVRRIAPDGTIHPAVGECHSARDGGFAGDGGDPRDALLDQPFGLHLDGNVLYVADTRNSRIRRVNL